MDHKDSKLFEADRRIIERENPSDRRFMFRPSTKLRVLGGLAALLVAAILSGLIYFLTRG
jgi:hypothetical protein